MSALAIEVPSPDASKAVLLAYDGEARFGPAFYRATSRGFPWPLGSSTLGEDVHWSPDSRYVVLLLFGSRDTSRPPNVALVAIDTMTGTVQKIDATNVGLIYQVGFSPDGKYAYRIESNAAEVEKVWTP